MKFYKKHILIQSSAVLMLVFAPTLLYASGRGKGKASEALTDIAGAIYSSAKNGCKAVFKSQVSNTEKTVSNAKKPDAANIFGLKSKVTDNTKNPTFSKNFEKYPEPNSKASSPEFDPKNFNYPDPAKHFKLNADGTVNVTIRGEIYSNLPVRTMTELEKDLKLDSRDIMTFYRAANNGQDKTSFMDEVAVFKYFSATLGTKATNPIREGQIIQKSREWNLSMNMGAVDEFGRRDGRYIILASGDPMLDHNKMAKTSRRPDQLMATGYDYDFAPSVYLQEYDRAVKNGYQVTEVVIGPFGIPLPVMTKREPNWATGTFRD